MANINLRKILIVLLLVLLALLSFLPAADWASAPETHSSTAAAIDSKVDTVLKLTAASTVASAGVSAIPGDTATPIAEKLADFTEYFLLVLCVLYAEKYLLVIIGAGVFKILIPCACLLVIIGMFWNSKVTNRLAAKLAVFGLVIFFTIPLSIRVSDMVYGNYQNSIESTISDAEQFGDDAAGLDAEGEEGLIGSIVSRLSETVSDLSDRASRLLNRFVESLAVLIVTSCIIPLLVLIFFLWLIRMLTGVKISIPAPLPRRRGSKLGGFGIKADLAPDSAEDDD